MVSHYDPPVGGEVIPKYEATSSHWEIASASQASPEFFGRSNEVLSV
ncbi:MAG: hypothetical protein WAU36_20010 [Cyclobacteriaceae bacterium]